jgi:ATP-dependent Clp protease adaptor protein ClpS
LSPRSRAARVEPPTLYQVGDAQRRLHAEEFRGTRLQEYFLRDLDTATQIVLKIHHEGRGVCASTA